jgi:hypothetical protein
MPQQRLDGLEVGPGRVRDSGRAGALVVQPDRRQLPIERQPQKHPRDPLRMQRRRTSE